MRILCSVLLLVGAFAAQASELLMSPQQVIEALKGNDSRAKYLAEGYLYLLPESTFPILMAEHARRPDQHVPDWGKTITLAMLLRGYTPAIEGYLSNWYGISKSQVAYSLKDELILQHGTVEELTVFARAYAKHLEKIPKDKNFAFQGNELWIRLAALTGEPSLMNHVLALANSRQGNYARGQMVNKFSPDLSGMALLPLMKDGETQVRIEVINMLRPGWHKGPSNAFLPLMKDQDPLIRKAFCKSLWSSSSDDAFKFITMGLQDTDSVVVNSCMHALTTFKGDGAGILLRRIALNEKAELFLRTQAWSSLANDKTNPLEKEAKALVMNDRGDRTLRNSAVQYLMSQNETAWLFNAVSRVDKEMKVVILRLLSYSGKQDVFNEIKDLLGKSDPDTAANLISIIGGLKNDDVISLLVSLVKDNRPLVRSAALTALANATGLRYDPQKENGEEATKEIVRAWQRWFEQFMEPMLPDLAGDVEELRVALAARNRTEHDVLPEVKDVYSALLRLAGDKDLGGKAIIEFGKLNDQRVAGDLIELINSPLLSRNAKEIMQALMLAKPSNAHIRTLEKLLEHVRTKRMAVQVLLAWRASSTALSEAILNDNLSSESEELLMSWKECPVFVVARKMMTDEKADPQRRARAMALIIELGEERDIKAFAREVSEVGPSCRLAIQGLVRMAANGSDGASRELAKLLKASIRQTPARPLRPSRQNEPPPTKPDTGPMIIDALKNRPRDPQGERMTLAGQLLDAVIEWTTKSEKEDLQISGLELLLESGDKAAFPLLRALLSSEDERISQRAFSLPLSLRGAAALPFVEMLPEYKDFDEKHVWEILKWYENSLKLPYEERRHIRKELLKKAELKAGIPVNGMILTYDIGGDTSPVGATDMKIKISIKNVAKTPYVFFPQHMSFSLYLCMDENDSSSSVYRLMPDFSPFPPAKPGPNGGSPVMTIPPGRTMTFMTLPFAGPSKGFVLSRHLIRLNWTVHGSLDPKNPGREGVFRTPWVPHMFIPPLFDEIDRRYTK